MTGPMVLLLGAYLAISPGVDMFLYPKLLAVFVGAFLCIKAPAGPSKVRRYFLLVIGVAVISALASASPLQSFLGRHPSPTVGILGMLACWLSYEAGLCQKTDSWGLITLGASICSILAIVQLNPRAPFYALLPSGRAIGTIGSPPFLGCMLALAIPLAAMTTARALIFIVPALLATRSKAAMIGAAVGVCVLVLLAYRDRIKGRSILLVGAAFILAILFIFSRGASDTMRLYTWKIALEAFLVRPWLGWGPDQFIDAFMQLRGPAWIEAAGHAGMTAPENAHNLFLNIQATQGLAGWFAHAIMAVAALRVISNLHPFERTERTVLLASSAAVLAYSMFNPTPFMAWAVLAFMLGTVEA